MVRTKATAAPCRCTASAVRGGGEPSRTGCTAESASTMEARAACSARAAAIRSSSACCSRDASSDRVTFAIGSSSTPRTSAPSARTWIESISTVSGSAGSSKARRPLGSTRPRRTTRAPSV